MLSRLRSQLPGWRRALRRRRRTLAILALAIAAAVLLPTLLPPSVQGVEVVVADEDLAAGTLLAPEHLRTVRIAPELVPPETPTAPEEVLGRTVARPLDAGSAFLPGLLEEPITALVPEGSVLMAVPVPDALAPHLVPGTRIELLSTDPTAVVRVPAQVLELAGSGSGTLGGAPAAAEVLVVVERSRAGEVAHALGTGSVMISVIG